LVVTYNKAIAEEKPSSGGPGADEGREKDETKARKMSKARKGGEQWVRRRRQ